MLTGTEEVPANTSPGTGTLEATYDSDSNVLNYTVTYSGLTGDATATDPACELSPLHARMFTVARQESAAEPPPFVYRRPRREAPPAPATLLDTASTHA